MKTTPQKSRFALPIAITVAAHAVLFFGFKAPDRTTSTRNPRPIVPIDSKVPPDFVELEPPPRSEVPTIPALKQPPPRGPEVLTDPTSSPFHTDYTHVDPIDPRAAVSTLPVEWNSVAGPRGPVGPMVFHPGDLDRVPRAEFRLAPAYPAELRASGISGEVYVDFLVDESGRVSDIHVVRSTHSAFEGPTVKALAKWRFEPGKRNGKPVRFRMAIPLRFTLGE